jgi:hypothetical protein
MVLALVQGWALLAAGARAQGPAGAGPTKYFTRRTTFELPVNIDDADRPGLQEVQLHVKTRPDEPWTLKEKALPSHKEFSYKVTQDGEYWFRVVTVDKNGVASPPDLAGQPPELIVVVDTQPPLVDVCPVPGAAGETVLQCKVTDANPDPVKVKLEYQAADKSWHPLTCQAEHPDLFPVVDATVLKNPVRVTATDRAGNVGTREISLAGNWAPAAAPATPASATMTATEAHADKAAVPAAPEVKPAETARPLVNNTHVALEYKIEEQGPSGVGKVDVYITRDNGETWEFLCEDADHRSPAEFNLPGEGVFGISLVVTNGLGLGGKPPAKGDQPDWWVEVDTTKPTARLHAVRPGTGGDAGCILIGWTASDANLGAKPIDLYYATHRDGPWQPIAKGLKNDGSYRWPFPRDIGSQLFVRLEVSDRAGNSNRCETPQPVLIDLAQPKAKVLGITASGPAPTPPLGH